MLKNTDDKISELTEKLLLKGIQTKSKAILTDIKAPVIEKDGVSRVSDSCKSLIAYLQPFIEVLQDEQLSPMNCERIKSVVFRDLLHNCIAVYSKAKMDQNLQLKNLVGVGLTIEGVDCKCGKAFLDNDLKVIYEELL